MIARSSSVPHFAINICVTTNLHVSFSSSKHYFHLIVVLLLFTTCGQSNAKGIRNSTRPSQRDLNLQASSAPKFAQNGGHFATGFIDLGGLIVTQSSKFKRVWRTHEGGSNDHGATFYEPSLLPDGYFMLGHYGYLKKKSSQHGRVLLVKDDTNGAVAKPLSYTLIWSSEKSNIKQNGIGYVWEPVPPKGYKALGHIVTATSEMPSFEKVRCLRSDFVEECPQSERIWGGEKHGVSIVRGISESHVPVGTFKAVQSHPNMTSSVHCLRNLNDIILPSPNLEEIQTLMYHNGPLIYFHPDEKYLPSTVDWFFQSGALLYHRGNEATPSRIEPTGSNIPQNGYNDGTFWLDLPVDWDGKERVSKGNLETAKGYLHAKPTLGGTATDLVIWIFFPYNGQATLTLLFVTIPLWGIGTHVGDWEHVTLRFNNFDGLLQSVYFSRHKKGEWIDAKDLEYVSESRPRIFASHNGHAMFPHAGFVPQGNKFFGLRNDMAKSEYYIAPGFSYEVISAEYLGVVEPPWVNFFGRWGPRIDYGLRRKLMKVKKFLVFGWLKRKFEKMVNSLPEELFWQDGPVGPKLKPSWNGDEEA